MNDDETDYENPDDVMEECSVCGRSVLEVYVEDGRCPDCRNG